MPYNRRKFIKGMAVAAAGIPFSGALAAGAGSMEKSRYPISFFTKPLDTYELEFMSESLAMAGVDGFDLTVRPRGRVIPERVQDDLPRVIETGRKHGLSTEMMVTAITDAEDAFSKKILTTAAQFGVKHYRLGYYDYDFATGIPKSLEQIKRKLSALAAINGEAGIQGGYQNHSGIRVGAAMWDVWELINAKPVCIISSQFDIRHAVTEASASWVIALQLLHKHIGSLAIKDFVWKVENGKARVVSTPLGEGIVDFDRFFGMVKDLKIAAPITLHAEYPLLTRDEENLSLLEQQKILVAKLKKDVDFISTYLEKYQLV
ncbi:sugar phosphate isomerase/epimerase family protein [Mariniphaga anaerophila]|nr:TIM barrel protein [Mariniphaga anaerophila]